MIFAILRYVVTATGIPKEFAAIVEATVNDLVDTSEVKLKRAL